MHRVFFEVDAEHSESQTSIAGPQNMRGWSYWVKLKRWAEATPRSP